MQFWVLQHEHSHWWMLGLSVRALSFGEENWWEVFRGNRPPPDEAAPFRVGKPVLAGSAQADVMYTDLLGMSFSARLAGLLLELKCTGFSPHPSLIYDAEDRQVVCADVKWTQFQRGCGLVDMERGYDVARPYRDPRRDQVGLYFDHGTWTGLDMFKPEKHPAIVISDRIANAIQAGSFKGYLLERAEEYGSHLVRAYHEWQALHGKHVKP